ncbi:hypothetical protein CL658_00795 [bacterium]|nr:hypothetical protein [bacterium]
MTLLKRILTALSLIILTATSIIFGKIPFYLLILTISLICLHEMHTIKGIRKYSFGYSISMLITCLVITSATFQEYIFFWNSTFIFLATFVMIVICLTELFNKQTIKKNHSLYTLIINTVIVCLTFPYALLIRNSELGFEKAILLVVVISLVDSSAYFTGKLIGKTKLSELSPKKTFEGFFGGIISGCIIGLVSIIILNLKISTYFPLVILITLMAPIGDLYESMIKRSFNIKNSSNLLPGHGGIFDRIDSYIFCFPVFYYINILLSSL